MEILGIALLVPLVVVSVTALFAALTLLLPAPIEAVRLKLEHLPGRSLVLGLVNFIFFAVLVAAFAWLSEQAGGVFAGILAFLAALILLGLSVLALFGLTAFAGLLGERIGGGNIPLSPTLRGGALLLLAGLAPYVGWFLFTPLVLWAGLGAAISALLPRRKKPESVDLESVS